MAPHFINLGGQAGWDPVSHYTVHALAKAYYGVTLNDLAGGSVSHCPGPGRRG